jgi:rhodanese-related sulfurtransferase
MPKLRNPIAVLLILTGGILALAACGTQIAPAKPTSEVDLAQQIQQVPVEGGGSYTDVSAAGLAAMLQNKDFPLINVHIPYAGEIEGTDLFIPYNEIEGNLDRLPTDKDARLVVYCRSGSMSAIAARTLLGLGYTNVWNLDGGMIAWEQAGYALVDKGS